MLNKWLYTHSHTQFQDTYTHIGWGKNFQSSSSSKTYVYDSIGCSKCRRSIENRHHFVESYIFAWFPLYPNICTIISIHTAGGERERERAREKKKKKTCTCQASTFSTSNFNSCKLNYWLRFNIFRCVVHNLVASRSIQKGTWSNALIPPPPPSLRPIDFHAWENSSDVNFVNQISVGKSKISSQ